MPRKIYKKILSLFAQKTGRDTEATLMDASHIDTLTSIGKYTYVGYNSFINKTQIGRYCSIANNTSIGMGEHTLNRISTNSLFYDNPKKMLLSNDCVIGNDVWIGVDCIVRRGVSIGNGAVIGANSFVNSDIPPYAIAVGSPAKVVKYRFTPEQIEIIEKSGWWNYDLEKAKTVMKELENELGIAKK